MSETQSARWVGLGLGLVLTLVFVLNAATRTEALDSATPLISTVASR